jgi:DNA polymerase
MAADHQSLEELRKEAQDCRACSLWRHATQTVFGEGQSHATMMLVGEQPGDKEDLEGTPFVGPAGQLLDRALVEAEIDRKKVYITNAVKHFKFARRGKIRLHQKPDTAEIVACGPWLHRERLIVRPKLIVAMGATAARAVFGKVMPIGKNRGEEFALEDATGMLTVHPSYILRLKDDDRTQQYRLFVSDLKSAARIARAAA